jgi:hypothetical protein
MTDPEVEAMGKVSAALSELNSEAIRRVLGWANQKFGVKAVGDSSAGAGTLKPFAEEAASQFPDFASFYDAVDPSNDNDRALVAGYWLQEVQQNPEWDSQAANSNLKNVGRGLANVAENLTRLMSVTPRLVIQTQKSGTTKQGRKKYKLTTVGIQRVRQMISANLSGREGG